MTPSKKIVLLGHFGVGKTSLVRRYVDAAFDESYLVTLGVQVKKKNVTVKEQEVALILWDIEGNQSVKNTRASYLLGSHGFVYVIDLLRPETFEALQENIDYLKEQYPQVPISVFGNKVDLIDPNELDDYLERNNLNDIHVTSAKEDRNVSLGFQMLTEKLLA